MQNKSHYNLCYKVCASALIILHLVTFGHMREALAFNASSANYKLNSGSANAGGKERSATSAKLWQDVVGEPCVGQAASANFKLNSGLLPTIESNQPVLTQNIPYQSWPINTAKEAAFDLDDYFISPDELPLSFSLRGNSQIKVTIDPATHLVSFSQAQDWSGAEKVYFTATDSEGNAFDSNEVTLQVINTTAGASNKPVIIETQTSPTMIKEGDLVKLTIKAADPDNQDLTFSYSGGYFSQTNTYKQGDFWVSEATWQTTANSKGHYTVDITVSDPTPLTDTKPLVVNVGNFNHPPVLADIPELTFNEGDLAVIKPQVTDSDNDPVVFYYSSPFDTQGKWLTNYASANTYQILVTASDGIDTVSKTAKVTILNTNQAPKVTLSSPDNRYTFKPKEEFTMLISSLDPDGDPMTFSLTDNGKEIARGSIASASSIVLTYPEKGKHILTAIVTDSAGLSATDSKSVDVVDPNPNRDVINPLMGDFDGNALTDLGLHNSETGEWEVCLSDKGAFRSAIVWLADFGKSASRAWWPIGGDFNGDAKTDVGIYNNTTGELKIALSNGGDPQTSQGSFSAGTTWLNFPQASYSWQPFTGNFNGDKYTDFALYNVDTGEVKAALATPPENAGQAGFTEPATWLTAAGSGYIALSGDFNGDGLSDLGLFKKSSGEFKVAFSNSKSFVDQSTWISGYATDKDALVSDFNNDGLTDIGYWDKAAARWYYAISTGSQFVDKGLWLDNFGSNDDESATTGDFDGNGLTDAATFDKDQLGIDRWTTKLSTNKPADLLTEIDNGIGGKTKITYTYAAAQDNPGLPFPVYVASSISLINTLPAERAATYTQNYSFSGGYFDTTEREFRGFAKVKAIDPVTHNYSETYFYQGKPGQDGSLKGQIDKIIAYDGNNRKISEAMNTYEVKKAGPEDRFLGFPSLKEQNTTVYEENGSSLSTKNTFSYDNLGNLLTATNLGDTAKTGDEKSTSTTYAQAYSYNTTDKSGFNRPLESSLKDKDANIVTKKTFEYDAKGNLSKEKLSILNPLTTDSQLSTTDYKYDDYGNLTSTTNALGKSVTTEYETDLYTYPAKVTNSLAHSITYTYDPKFGVVKSVTDANGATSSTSYDSFGRAIEVRNAFDQAVTTYTYPDFNTKTTTNALNLFKTEYIDGLGRKYKTVSSGEDGLNQRNISTEVFYNDRGLTDRESLPHYIDEEEGNISYIRYRYDKRGRIAETISDFATPMQDTGEPGEYGQLTGKDTFSKISYITPLYIETTDPQGHRKGTLKDVYGNILEVREFVHQDNETQPDGAFHTYYSYDIQNNLTKTTDNKGNSTQIFYDSIGRKLKMIDPDMGTWSYEYDILGNLKKQTDAKGQILEFDYDDLNRLVKKSSLRGGATGADEAILAQYFYDDPTKPNCLGRLSKITDLSGSTEFFYDKLGREVKSVKAIQKSEDRSQKTEYTVEREYDILDRLTKLTYPDAEAVTYSYSPNSGLLKSVRGLSPQQGTVPEQPYVQDISYSANGQMKSILYGNGVTTDYTYGQDLRLLNISTIHNPSSTTLQDLHYTFDHNGNLTTLTDGLRNNATPRTYAYDDLDRLISAKNAPAPGGIYGDFYYSYDSIGNMREKTEPGKPTINMEYGNGAGPHALTFAGGYSYQYDANGNMTVGKNKTLSYDLENRLTSVNELGVITSFVYDGDGGRVKKTTGSDSTTYIGSLFEIREQGTGDREQVKHIFAGANRIATVTANPVIPAQAGIQYYHSDHLGSSNAITDKDGNLAQYCEYTPYGTIATNDVIASPAGAKQSPISHYFTGKELDRTGLYFYGARYYDPEIGRFITADTIVQAPYNPQTLNRYSYCGNNPINYVDPTGHFWFFAFLAFVAISAAIGAVANVAIAGAMGQLTSWTAVWAAMGAGAVGGAVAGVGGIALGPAAATIWGGIGIGIAAGAAGGAVGSSISGAFSWGAVGLGAAYGGALGGFGNSSAGRAFGKSIGKGIGKLPFGQHIQNAGKALGSTMSRLYSEAKGIVGPARASLSVRSAGNSNEPIELGTIRVIKKASGGESVYRQWGGEAGPNGQSWSPENPATPGYENRMGIPTQPGANTGEFISKGTFKPGASYYQQPASGIGTNTGGGTEYGVPNPQEDIRLDWVHMPDDE